MLKIRLRRYVPFLLKALSSIMVLFGASLCWMKWPEWTSEEFVSLIRDGKFERTNRLMAAPYHWHTDRRWTLVIETAGAQYTRARLIRSDCGRQPIESEEWILLDTPLTGKEKITQSAVPGYLLPAKQWVEWFQPGFLEWVPRRRIDYLRGTRRLRTLNGHCEFLVRFGCVSVLTASRDFQSFLDTRSGETYDIPGWDDMACEVGSDAAKNEVFFGPYITESNTIDIFSANRAQSERLYSTTELAKRLAERR